MGCVPIIDLYLSFRGLMRSIKVNLLLMLPLILTGCEILAESIMNPTQMYDGPPQAMVNIATIYERGVSIYSINGRSPGNFHSPALQVIPGEQRLMVEYITTYSTAAWKTTTTSTHRLSFIAQAGHEYEVHGDAFVMGTGTCVWVEDRATGKKLAGSDEWCMRDA